MLFLFQINLI